MVVDLNNQNYLSMEWQTIDMADVGYRVCIGFESSALYRDSTIIVEYYSSNNFRGFYCE